MTVQRPKFINTPLAQGLHWRGGAGWRFEEKMDGVWATKEASGSILIGEQMRDGRFFTFDVAQHNGADVRKLALRDRLAILNDMPGLLRPAAGNGAEFLEAVLARAGEGVVAKFLDAPYGECWHKCKRIETFDCIVTEKYMPSIRLRSLDGEDRGFCCARAAYDSIKPGDIVEVAAYGITAKGKLREPRFVRIRHDKMARI
jgi:ATP-dependent DNA ligase